MIIGTRDAASNKWSMRPDPDDDVRRRRYFRKKNFNGHEACRA